MSGQELIDYLSALNNTMRKSGQITAQIRDDTVTLILTELINSKNEIEHLRNCVMSEDEVKKLEDTRLELIDDSLLLEKLKSDKRNW